MTHGSISGREAACPRAASWIGARREIFILRSQFIARLLFLAKGALARKAAAALEYAGK